MTAGGNGGCQHQRVRGVGDGAFAGRCWHCDATTKVLSAEVQAEQARSQSATPKDAVGIAQNL